eukprot:750514-Hanusia_phi.AAC.1
MQRRRQITIKPVGIISTPSFACCQPNLILLHHYIQNKLCPCQVLNGNQTALKPDSRNKRQSSRTALFPQQSGFIHFIQKSDRTAGRDCGGYGMGRADNRRREEEKE